GSSAAERLQLLQEPEQLRLLVLRQAREAVARLPALPSWARIASSIEAARPSCRKVVRRRMPQSGAVRNSRPRRLSLCDPVAEAAHVVEEEVGIGTDRLLAEPGDVRRSGAASRTPRARATRSGVPASARACGADVRTPRRSRLVVRARSVDRARGAG